MNYTEYKRQRIIECPFRGIRESGKDKNETDKNT